MQLFREATKRPGETLPITVTMLIFFSTSTFVAKNLCEIQLLSSFVFLLIMPQVMLNTCMQDTVGNVLYAVIR